MSTSAPSPSADTDRALDHAGDLAGLLAEAGRETRARLYQALDLVLNLDPVGDPPTLDVRLQLCGGGGPIVALAPTDPANVRVKAVLWLDEERSA